jgi:nucleoside-diphosphate-sugar epimerase
MGGGRNPAFRRVIVTGANGKVGVRVVQSFKASGDGGKPWEVVATDVGRGVFDTPGATDPWNYQQADLTDAGEVFSMIARFQVRKKTSSWPRNLVNFSLF